MLHFLCRNNPRPAVFLWKRCCTYAKAKEEELVSPLSDSPTAVKPHNEAISMHKQRTFPVKCGPLEVKDYVNIK